MESGDRSSRDRWEKGRLAAAMVLSLRGFRAHFESARISANLICEKHGIPYAKPKPHPEPTLE